MQFLSWLVGPNITEHLQQGREIDQVIARQDNSILARSTTELERYFKQPAESLPRQNGFPVAIVLMLLLVSFAFNLLTFLHALPPLSPQIHALSFLFPQSSLLARYSRPVTCLREAIQPVWRGWLTSVRCCLYRPFYS